MLGSPAKIKVTSSAHVVINVYRQLLAVSLPLALIGLSLFCYYQYVATLDIAIGEAGQVIARSVDSDIKTRQDVLSKGATDGLFQEMLSYRHITLEFFSQLNLPSL